SPKPDQQQQDGELPSMEAITRMMDEAVAQAAEQQVAFTARMDIALAKISAILEPKFALTAADVEALYTLYQGPDYSDSISRFTALSKAISLAQTNTANIEKAAADQSNALQQAVISASNYTKMGLTQTQASQLASVVTAPMKALGAAGSISATAKALNESVTAMSIAAGKGGAISETVIQSLTAAVAKLTTSSEKVVKIVTAAISASQKVWNDVFTQAKTAHTNGTPAADILTQAKNSAASLLNTKVTQELAGKDVTYGELSDLVDDLTSGITSVKALMSEIPTSDAIAAALSAMDYAEKAAQQADETATQAEASVNATTPDAMVAAADLALAAWKLAIQYGEDADTAVDEGVLGQGLDASALAVYAEILLGLTDAEALTDSGNDTQSYDWLDAMEDYLSGQAQQDAANANNTVVSAKASMDGSLEDANAAAANLTAARATLADKLVTKAIAVAKAAAYRTAVDNAQTALADAQTDVATSQNAVAAAQAVYDAAQAAANAAPGDSALAALATLRAQQLANVQAELAFNQQLETLYQSAYDKAGTNATDAEAEAATATTDADTAQTAVDDLLTTYETKLATYLTETQAYSDAQEAAAKATGYLGVGQA
ncbi:MAG: hypothetical protein HQL36_11885, partial [Alphaproteobacteria bacterium]|nr:hypothetical protein [Alphaproteobacteria bacterium]